MAGRRSPGRSSRWCRRRAPRGARRPYAIRRATTPRPDCGRFGNRVCGRWASTARQLVVGKNIWVRNTLTGQINKTVFNEGGQRLVMNVTKGTAPEQSEVGAALENGVLGLSTAYTIKDGKIVTNFGNKPYEMTVLKMGDRYLAARSNEFGFANYELVSQPKQLDPLDVPKDASLNPLGPNPKPAAEAGAPTRQ